MNALSVGGELRQREAHAFGLNHSDGCGEFPTAKEASQMTRTYDGGNVRRALR